MYKNNSKCRVLVTGGGTGGHLFPAIEIAREFSERGHCVSLVTDFRCKKYIDRTFSFDVNFIRFKLDQSNPLRLAKSFIEFICSLVKVSSIFKAFKPQIVIGFGGYPTLPVMVLSVAKRIPTAIHEQNSILCKTNKILAPFAKIVCLSYKDTYGTEKIRPDKLIFTGHIVRKEIREITKKFELNHTKLRIMVIGGSQGAAIFADLIPKAIELCLKNYPELDLKIVQQVSDSKDILKLQNFYLNLGVDCSISKFFDNMPELYSETDLMIARAGASTIAESISIAIPTLFIPYPHAAQNHQYLNAKILKDSGCALCFEEREVTPELLSRVISKVAKDRGLLRAMSAKLRSIPVAGTEKLREAILRMHL
jgi:UDP-N-acetylglucosamine--N-acetylmuramyl-(pentapeptide) pyrophosphoryl-undecaprenol N-acetylglucosamine transferase